MEVIETEVGEVTMKIRCIGVNEDVRMVIPSARIKWKDSGSYLYEPLEDSNYDNMVVSYHLEHQKFRKNSDK